MSVEALEIRIKSFVLALPDMVMSISMIAEEWRPLYDQTKAGCFLKEEVAAMIKADKAELMQSLKDLQAADRKIAAIQADRQAATATVALTRALAQGGVDPQKLRAATALVTSQYKFEVDEPDADGEPVVRGSDKFGQHALQTIVERFIDSEGGKPFLDEKQVSSTGKFGLMTDLLKHKP